MSLVVLLLNEHSLKLANRIISHTGGRVEVLAARAKKHPHVFSDIGTRLRELFEKRETIIAVMSSGIVIRMLAPVLNDKTSEPPVLCVSEDGGQVIPLLGGHHGANSLARDMAKLLTANAAITTAGEIQYGVAIDAPPPQYKLANPENAKAVMAELVAGARVRLNGSARWLEESRLPFSDDGIVTLSVTQYPKNTEPMELVYHPKCAVLGLGCERGTAFEQVYSLAQSAIQKSGLAPQSIAAIASVDLKADETALHEVANALGVEARFFPAEALEQLTPKLANPSKIVFREIGCHGVAEAACLAFAGEGAELIVEKTKSKRATAAIAVSRTPYVNLNLGRKRGRLFVLGIGPGAEYWRSPQVDRMLDMSSDLVGYSLYLDLVADITKGKERHDFALGREEDRVRHAMELAGEGKDVALVCSGDAGIYAMATLVFELLDHGNLSDGAQRIDIELAPGISALQAAASRIGAPLGHDFCTISLSDLLTPWVDIQRRIKAAGEGDFVIAFYNPVSRRRRTQLAYARDELLRYRPAQTPVILATNLGRDGEKIRIVELAKLQVDDVDMLTVVIVGSSNSKKIITGDGREWVYTPRGYSAKAGSQLESNVIDAAKELT